MSNIDLVLLVCLGLVAWATQYFNTLAFRAGEAAVVAPLVYTRLLYVFVLCFVFLGQWPEPRLLLGAAIIIFAGIFAIRLRDEHDPKYRIKKNLMLRRWPRRLISTFAR